MSYAASRAWKIQWDRFVIPMPGARIVIAVGEPVYVAKGLDAAGLGRLQEEMERKLLGLYAPGPGFVGSVGSSPKNTIA